MAETKKTADVSVKDKTLETIKTIAYAVGLALLIRTFLFQVFLIPSGSMIPTFEIGDRVIIPKYTYGIQNPFYNAAQKTKVLFIFPNPWYHNSMGISKNKYWVKFKRKINRFEVVVFFPPEYPVGGPVYYFQNNKSNFPIYFETPQLLGETYVKRIIGLPGEILELKNGVVFIDGKPLKETHTYNRDYADWGPIQIPKNCYFAMGDNRARSSDSRVWGLLPEDNIIGNVKLVMWPIKNIKYIPDPKK